MSICRTCAKIVGSKRTFTSVFAKQGNATIAEMITDCTSVQIYENDDLSKKICTKCLEDLCFSYEFRLKCLEVDNNWKEPAESQDGQNIKIEEIEIHEIIDEDDPQYEEPDNVKFKSPKLKIERLEDQNIKRKFADPIKVRVKKEKVETITTAPSNPAYDKIKKEMAEVKKLLNIIERSNSTAEEKAEELELLQKLEMSLSTTEFSIKSKLNPADPETSAENNEDIRKFVTSFTSEIFGVEQDDEAEDPTYATPKTKVRASISSSFRRPPIKEQCCAVGCTASFKTYDELELHSEVEHRKDPIELGFEPDIVRQCAICYEIYKGSEYRINGSKHGSTHMAKRMNVINAPCCGCSAIFTTYEDLQLHSALHEPNKVVDPARPYECDICFVRYTSMDKLKEHKRYGKIQRSIIRDKKVKAITYELEETDEVRCCACPEKFDTMEDLNKHGETHREFILTTPMENKAHECKVCHKWFQSEALVERHQMKPYRIKKCICPTCGDAFVDAKDLNTHEKSHKKDEETPWFACTLCDKKFKSARTFKDHMDMHAGGGWACHICGDIKSNKGKLQLHLTQHSDETPFSCKICFKKFKRMDLVKTHMRVHTGERPYVCKYCNQGFAHWSDCNRHQMVHTGDYPYSCSICNKKFARKTHFEAHEASHGVI